MGTFSPVLGAGARALSAWCLPERIMSGSAWYQVWNITRRAFSQMIRWRYEHSLNHALYPAHSTISHRQFGFRFAYLGLNSVLPGLVRSVNVFSVARRRVLAAAPITNH